MGLPGEPISELKKQVGWFYRLEKKTFQLISFFTKMSLHDYENLCSLDCLGIGEKHEKNNEFVSNLEKLGRSRFCWEI